jgi:hypothetical protein
MNIFAMTAVFLQTGTKLQQARFIGASGAVLTGGTASGDQCFRFYGNAVWYG